MSNKPAFTIIRDALPASDKNLPVIELSADRFTIAKRRWRGVAADGHEFGFDLEHPLSHGETFFQSETYRYCIVQSPESVLRLAITSPAHAAVIGWQIGNLHLRIMVEGDFLMAEDDPAVRHMLEREGIAFAATTAVFQPLAGPARHEHHHH